MKRSIQNMHIITDPRKHVPHAKLLTRNLNSASLIMRWTKALMTMMTTTKILTMNLSMPWKIGFTPWRRRSQI